MRLQELINLMEKSIKLERECLEDKKQSISSNYTLAKIDFTCIDNISDALNVYNHILDDLNALQNRVIKRNRGE